MAIGIGSPKSPSPPPDDISLFSLIRVEMSVVRFTAYTNTVDIAKQFYHFYH